MRSIDLVNDVLNTLGEHAESRIGWSVNGRLQRRRDIVPASLGDTVALKDRFWTELERRKTDSLRVSRWFQVETLMPETMGDFLSLSELFGGLHLVAFDEEEPPTGYQGLTTRAKGVMESLKVRSDRSLSAAGARDDELRATVLLVVDVFDQVYELLHHIVPLIRDKLLEVMGGPMDGEFHEMKYKLKEGDATHLANRMEVVMFDRILQIVMFVEGKLGTGPASAAPI